MLVRNAFGVQVPGLRALFALTLALTVGSALHYLYRGSGGGAAAGTGGA